MKQLTMIRVVYCNVTKYLLVELFIVFEHTCRQASVVDLSNCVNGLNIFIKLTIHNHMTSLMVCCCIIYMETPNNGHLGDIEIVLYREVSCIQRLNNTLNISMGMERVSFIKRCPLFRVSFVRGSTVVKP